MADSAMRYLKRSHNRWHFIKSVPRDVRGVVGKSNIVINLETTDLAEAKKRRAKALAIAERIINSARSHQERPKDELLESALSTRIDPPRYVGGEYDGEIATEVLSSEAEKLEQVVGNKRAKLWYDIASGTTTPITSFVADWNSQTQVIPRTAEVRAKAIHKFESWANDKHAVGAIEGCSRKIAGFYVSYLHDKGLAPATINKTLSFFTSYWSWLCRRGIASENIWQNQRLSQKKGSASPQRRSVTDSELLTLLSWADQNEDTSAHDVILCLALSGLRASELASLRVREILLDELGSEGVFNVVESKTRAGVRKVPIHSVILPIIEERLMGKDPYDHVFDEIQSKSNREAGARLSQLGSKWFRASGVAELEPGARQSNTSLHSLRHWTTNQLERAGVLDSIAAWLLGHERTGITLSVYSRRGPKMSQLREAIEKLSLP